MKQYLWFQYQMCCLEHFVICFSEQTFTDVLDKESEVIKVVWLVTVATPPGFEIPNSSLCWSQKHKSNQISGLPWSSSPFIQTLKCTKMSWCIIFSAFKRTAGCFVSVCTTFCYIKRISFCI